jgi:hypothetical protein
MDSLMLEHNKHQGFNMKKMILINKWMCTQIRL